MISVLCPSRGRPTFARDLLESMRATGIMLYNQLVLRLDDDDPSLAEYGNLVTGSDVTIIVGPRVVLSQCWNEAYAKAGNDIAMLCGDDIRFRSYGWDNRVAETIHGWPDRLVLVHGQDGIQGDRVATHPFLHRAWVDVVGYFVPPLFASDWNDMWLTEVADGIGRRVYLPDVYTEHLHPVAGKHYFDQTHQERMARHQAEDCDRIYRETVEDRARDIQKLRLVIEEAAMTINPDQNQPGPRPEPQVETSVTDSPQPGWQNESTESTELKGEALDKALEDAGLPKTGTADEKRERLAENQAGGGSDQ